MHEFDCFIVTELKDFVSQYNTSTGRLKKPRNKKYDALQKRIQYFRNKYLKLKSKTNCKFIELDESLKNKLLENRKTLRILIQERRNIPSLRPENREIIITFARYADDWIILTNCSGSFAKTLKNKIGDWLKTNLKLNLSPTKTIITNLKTSPIL